MPLRSLLLMAFCWLLGTLFSALHACLENTTGAALEAFAEQRGRSRIMGSRLSAIRAIIKNIPAYEHAVALARILCNLGVAVSSVFVVAAGRTAPGEPVVPGVIDAAVGVVASAIVMWVFAVSVAESIGRHAAERFLFAFGPFARAAYLVQLPLTPLSSAIETIVRKVAGAEKIDKGEEVSEEILSMAEEGEREGLIDVDERRMIEAVVNFKHRTVEQIMTPRNEIEALEYTDNLGAITAFVRKVRHSRIPVYKTGGGLDNVIGFFYTKDLLRWLAGDMGTGTPTLRVGSDPGTPTLRVGSSDSDATRSVAVPKGGFSLKNILRPALHVPDSKTIRQLADEFVSRKVHAAMVVDEYGAITGLVTLEDIIEDVFGDIQDEFEKTEDAPPRIDVYADPDAGTCGGGIANIDARAYVAQANQALEPLGAAIPESDDYDTVGGFVLSTLGHMPEINETFSHGPMTVTVLEASPTRVIKVRIRVAPDHPAEQHPEPAAERAK